VEIRKLLIVLTILGWASESRVESFQLIAFHARTDSSYSVPWLRRQSSELLLETVDSDRGQSEARECMDSADLKALPMGADWVVKQTWGDPILYPEFDCHKLKVYSNGEVVYQHRLQGQILNVDRFSLDSQSLLKIADIVARVCLSRSTNAGKCVAMASEAGRARLKSDCTATLSIEFFRMGKKDVETKNLECATDEPNRDIGDSLFLTVKRVVRDRFKLQ